MTMADKPRQEERQQGLDEGIQKGRLEGIRDELIGYLWQY